MYSIFFAIIIVFSNYLFRFQINEWLTYGALLFPISFLFTDILSEKLGRKFAYNVVRNGIFISIIPTFIIVDIRIAIGSIIAYFVSQNLDIYIFDYIKKTKYNKWYIRNNVSTFISQVVDSVLFFLISFAGILPLFELIKLIVGAIIIKWIMALLDTPLFYYFGIKK